MNLMHFSAPFARAAWTAAACGALVACSGNDDVDPVANADGGSSEGGGGGGGARDSGSRDAGTSGTGTGGGATLGQAYTGGEFHLGPVDYAETQWHNACAPEGGYAPAIQSVEGNMLAGLWNGIPNVASYCDACIKVTTAKGKTALLRVVTYGDTSTNSIDVSQTAYDALNSGEYPRSMTWQFAECDDTGKLIYEFQTGAHEDWTSLWVRNARLPIAKVEVQSKKHPSFVELTRGSDGTLTDGSGFGVGNFTLRLTSIDGKVVTESLVWPAAGIGGAMITGNQQFP